MLTVYSLMMCVEIWKRQQFWIMILHLEVWSLLIFLSRPKMERARFSAGFLSWGPKLCNCIHFSCCRQKCAETLQVQLRFWSLMKSQSRIWFSCISIYYNWHIAGVLFFIPVEWWLNHRYCMINSMHTWEYIYKKGICLASCYKYNLKDLEKMNLCFRWIISDAIMPIGLMVL